MFEFLGIIVNIFAAAAPLALSPDFAPEDRVSSKTEPQIASVAAVTAVTGVTTGHLALKSYTLTLAGTAPTNGDNDGYADTDETIDLTLTLINKTGKNLNDVAVRLATYDQKIACIGTFEVEIAAVAAGATFTTPPFQFRVAGASLVNRSNTDVPLDATFDVRVRADEFQQLDLPMGFTLSLDLDATGGSGTSAYVENFEIGGTNFGKFTLSTLDAGKNSLALSNGMRCQYNDPDGPNSNDPGRLDCFLGFPGDPPPGVNDWHIHDAISAHGGVGRAYTGAKSLHWGVHNSAGTPRRDTMRFKQLDAVKSLAINLPLTSAVPELVFAHQVSLADNRLIGGQDPGESADRAVVEVNVLTSGGAETPIWKKIYPYMNEYDQSGTDQYFNCTFDPTDDGNNEDSYFNPGDPGRFYGPSSTCYPERIFACAGNTDYRFPASPSNIGLAGDGPGLAGSVNVGTWVQPRFNLQEFAGRRIKVRFLATTIELEFAQTYDSGFFNQDDILDDGWFIDDVRVNQAIGTAMTVTADTKTISSLPCPLCQSITAALTATPEVVPAPGSPVTLDAGGSAVNVCSTSPPQFQFWIDGNFNGIPGDAGDSMVRDFAEEPTLAITPENSYQYAVVVRCPSAPACDAADGSNTASAPTTMTCNSGFPYQRFPQTVYVDRRFGIGSLPAQAMLRWEVADSVDVIRGLLSSDLPLPPTLALRSEGSFEDTVEECLVNSGNPTTSVVDFGVPELNTGYYYLVRAGIASTTCAQPPGWTTNAAKERPGRETELPANVMICP